MIQTSALSMDGIGIVNEKQTGNTGLLRRILDGDDAAFDTFVGSYYRLVASIASRFFRRSEVIEDICQEVFTKAFRSLSDVRTEEAVPGWLARICTNTCYDALRKQRRSREINQSEFSDEVHSYILEVASSEEYSPDRLREREEQREYAERVLDTLDPADRMVLTLMFLEELSVAEIAVRTGWSVANVKVRAFRARRRLRKILQDSKSKLGEEL